MIEGQLVYQWSELAKQLNSCVDINGVIGWVISNGSGEHLTLQLKEDARQFVRISLDEVETFSLLRD